MNDGLDYAYCGAVENPYDLGERFDFAERKCSFEIAGALEQKTIKPEYREHRN